jgi:hypothetical protein
MHSIRKSDGTLEPFSTQKLIESLVKAGATDDTASRICDTVALTLPEETTSEHIYKRAHTMLKREAHPVAARYAMRRAIFDLGPTGHPFEDFVAEVLKAEGWTVDRRQTIAGKCVSHEVDVYAHRDGKYLVAELKYHNDPQYKTDIKVALYVKSRLDDIANCGPSDNNVCRVDQGYLITNTKFTDTAIAYAQCCGLNLMGWTYPDTGNLYDRVIAAGIYPITVLTSLKKTEKIFLISRNIVTCNQLLSHQEALKDMSISHERIAPILSEIRLICGIVE